MCRRISTGLGSSCQAGLCASSGYSIGCSVTDENVPPSNVLERDRLHRLTAQARKNYENNQTKYQERKRGPDAHAPWRAESNGGKLEEVWSCDRSASGQASGTQARKPQAKHYEVVKKGRVGPQANKLASKR